MSLHSTPNRVWVVIPTYWTWPYVEGAPRKASAFDHPTPVDGESTLPRLLQSLCKQTFSQFDVLVLAGSADADLAQQTSMRMAILLDDYDERLSLHLCDWDVCARLCRMLSSAGLQNAGLNMTSYAGIRNLQLVVPHLAGAEVIIALDDDELVPSDFVAHAVETIGQEIDDASVLGVAGPYADDEGSVWLPEVPLTGNIFHDKPHIMNAGLKALLDSPRDTVRSPQVLGGNMTFHRDMFVQVGFDPGITRGEDMDYVINARAVGMDWWLHTDLRVTHLPPDHHRAPPYDLLRKDVIRFIYERAKIHGYGLRSAEFEPYPGRFLHGDLEEHAVAVLTDKGTSETFSIYGTPADILHEAESNVRTHLPQYEEFVTGWQELMHIIDTDESLRVKLCTAIFQEGAA